MTDCVLRHEFLSSLNDVYYSHAHPRDLPVCNGSDSAPRTRHYNQTCNKVWFLGVNRDGAVRVVKAPLSNAGQNVLFIQYWVSAAHTATPSYVLPDLTTSTTPVPGTSAAALRRRFI